MEVEAPMRGEGKHRWWEDPECHHNPKIRPELAEGFGKRTLAHGCGLQQGKAVMESGLFYRRRHECLPAATRFVGPRHDGADVVSTGEKDLKAGDGEVGRPHKHEPEGDGWTPCG